MAHASKSKSIVRSDGAHRQEHWTCSPRTKRASILEMPKELTRRISQQAGVYRFPKIASWW